MMTEITGYPLHHNYHYHDHYRCRISLKFKHNFNKIHCSKEAASGTGSVNFDVNKGNAVSERKISEML
jgi:hypothetical protein